MPDLLPTLARLTLAAGLAGALGGCLNIATADPYPVYGNPVNPTPVRGYRLECESQPSPAYWLTSDVLTGCRQVIDPSAAIVRAKG